jgi:hypothetical protein
MQVQIGAQTLKFVSDPDYEQPTTLFLLPEWSEFRSENSRQGLEGERVMFTLEPGDSENADSLGEPAAYSRAIEWFLANRMKIKESALEALTGYIDVLRNDYGLDDEELNAFSSKSQLVKMVDISFVHFYPQIKADKPFFALELECNWDPEHGYGIMFHGSDVLDIGIDVYQHHPTEYSGT